MKPALLILLLAVAVGAWLWLNPEHADDLKAVLPDNGLTTKTDVIYKWRNDAGEWQLTDTPPPAGVEYERTDYREDVNVLPAPPALETD